MRRDEAARTDRPAASAGPLVPPFVGAVVPG